MTYPRTRKQRRLRTRRLRKRYVKKVKLRERVRRDASVVPPRTVSRHASRRARVSRLCAHPARTPHEAHPLCLRRRHQRSARARRRPRRTRRLPSGATHSVSTRSPSACDEREATVETVSEETLTVSARSARRSSTAAYPSAPAVTTRRLPTHCAISLTAPARARARARALPPRGGRLGGRPRSAPRRSWPPDASSGVAFGSAPSTQRRAVQWPSCASRDDTNEPDAASQRSTAPPRSPLGQRREIQPARCAERVVANVGGRRRSRRSRDERRGRAPALGAREASRLL